MSKIAGNVFNLLVVINCSVNFVLYSSFSSKFRMTFRRLFCHRRRRCCCLGSDVDELRWLRDNEDGIEMTCSRGDRATAAVTGGGSSPSPLAHGPRQRRGETVVVVATPGGGRTYVKRQRSYDRKTLAPTTTIEITSHCGLTTTSMLTPVGSQSSVSDTSRVSDTTSSVSDTSVGLPLAPCEHTHVVLESS